MITCHLFCQSHGMKQNAGSCIQPASPERNLEGVLKVHCLDLWSITDFDPSLTANILIHPRPSPNIKSGNFHDIDFSWHCAALEPTLCLTSCANVYWKCQQWRVKKPDKTLRWWASWEFNPGVYFHLRTQTHIPARPSINFHNKTSTTHSEGQQRTVNDHIPQWTILPYSWSPHMTLNNTLHPSVGEAFCQPYLARWLLQSSSSHHIASQRGLRGARLACKHNKHKESQTDCLHAYDRGLQQITQHNTHTDTYNQYMHIHHPVSGLVYMTKLCKLNTSSLRWYHLRQMTPRREGI